MEVLGIIPARYDSVRFPGKPLVDIAGKTMIQRVYEQATKANLLNKVIVATDDVRIYNHVISFGGNVLMTSKMHENGTSRCYEVIEKLSGNNFDYVVNIQGDEPFIQPEQIDELANLIATEKSSIATQVKKEFDLSLLSNPTIVKTIITDDFICKDFVRIITTQDIATSFFYKHIGLYAFNTSVLEKIVQLPVSINETNRKLEQMRWLDNDFSIKIGVTTHESISIDTKEDLERAIRLFT